ncbi:MAG: hypothetical protein WC002_04115 [Candidatus Muiribacteriota bacterium]
MKILIDGVDFQAHHNGLTELIKAVAEHCASTQKVVKSLTVDGKHVVTDINSLQNNTFKDIQTLEFFTVSYENLCYNTLEEMADYLEKLEQGYDSIVSLVDSNKVDDAMSVLNAATAGIEWMNTAFSKIINILKIELTDEENDFIKTYLDHLNDLVAALEKTDYVDLKDIITYDLKNDIIEWRKLLQKYNKRG